MSQRLFTVAKVAIFLDGYAPGKEKRRGETVKIITLTLRVQPFDAALAVAVDDGLGGDTSVRPQLFSLTTGEPKKHIERVNMSLDCPRQTLHIFAAPDITDARLVIPQVKVSGFYARTQKDVSGYAFVCHASFGPVGRDELEFLQHWYLNSQFVTFEEAEPGLFEDDDEGEDLLAAPVSGRPTPEWDDGDEAPAAAAAPLEDDRAREVGATPAKQRGTKKRAGRHNPDVERAAQVKAATGKRNARGAALA